MKKTLFYPCLWGVLTMFLLFACRTDQSVNDQSTGQKEKIAAFERFEKENNIIKPIAGNDQNTGSTKYVSYSYPFALIIYNFLQNHPDYAKQIENEVGIIRLDAVSQTLGEAKKSVIFPVTNNEGKVVAIWGGVINENRDYVSFYTLNNSQEVNTIKAEFQNYYDQKERRLANNAVASIKGLNPIALKPEAPKDPPVKEKEIPEVVITVPKCDCDVPKIPGAGGPDPNGINGNNPAGGMNGGPTTHGGAGNGTPSDGQKDQCSKAKAVSEKANAVLKDGKVKEQVADVLDKKKSEKNEFAISVGKNTNGDPTFSDLKEGSAGESSVPPPPGEYIANAHTHPEGGAAPPSVVDLYTTLSINLYSTNSFVGSYVFSYNGSVYMIAVNDREAAKAFLQKYPKAENVNPGRTEFNDKNDIGQDYKSIRDCYYGGSCNKTTMSDQDAGMEAGLAYIMEKYKTGLSLLKGDKNGNFKGITASDGKIYDSVNKEYKNGYVSSPCNN